MDEKTGREDVVPPTEDDRGKEAVESGEAIRPNDEKERADADKHADPPAITKDEDGGVDEGKTDKAEEHKADDEKERMKKADTSAAEEEATRKILFSLCYLWGILFFLPLVMYKDDEDAKMHANEGLNLLLLSIVVNLVLGIITGAAGGTVGVVFGVFIGIFNVAILLLGIYGIVGVVTEKHRPLPVIGSIRLIK